MIRAVCRSCGAEREVSAAVAKLPLRCSKCGVGTLDAAGGVAAPGVPGPNTSTRGEDPVAKACYAMAYFVLPRDLFRAPPGVLRALESDRALAAAAFYLMACEGDEPPPGVLGSFAVHVGALDDGRRHYVVQYPVPPSHEDERRAGRRVVLAPHFSAAVEDLRTRGVTYFVLGQRLVGGTTLRQVTAPDRLGENRGPGCEPDLGAFLGLLRQTLPAR